MTIYLPCIDEKIDALPINATVSRMTLSTTLLGTRKIAPLVVTTRTTVAQVLLGFLPVPYTIPYQLLWASLCPR